MRMLAVKKTNVQDVLHLHFPIYSLSSLVNFALSLDSLTCVGSLRWGPLPSRLWFDEAKGQGRLVCRRWGWGRHQSLASSFRGPKSVAGFYLVALSTHRSVQRQTSCLSRPTQVRERLPALTSPRVFRSHCCCPYLCPLLRKQSLH